MEGRVGDPWKYKEQGREGDREEYKEQEELTVGHRFASSVGHREVLVWGVVW